MKAPARWLAALALALVSAVPAHAGPKQLIEFGWDEPTTAFMREHVSQLRASPFDGCVYHATYRAADGDTGNFAWSLWGRRRFTSRELAQASADLRATDFGPFRANFLRVNVTPGDLDWFEDHGSVMANLTLAARLARQGGGPGILFDIEQYRDSLWDYRVQARRHGQGWNELSAQVRRRGAAAMRALERGYPGLTVLLTLGYSLPLHETGGGRHPLTVTHNGLLVPFLDGMFAAASPRAIIVDGHEHSYGAREPAEFAARADSMRSGVRRLLAHPTRYRRHGRIAFGIWLDDESPIVGWDPTDPSRNRRTPGSFGKAVQAALDYTDHYVWIYSEQPRWWSAAGHPLRLPADYDSVLRAVRR